MLRNNEGRLKASAGISRTLNLGSFRSYRIELAVEFYPDEHTHEEVIKRLDDKLRASIRTVGLTERND